MSKMNNNRRKVLLAFFIGLGVLALLYIGFFIGFALVYQGLREAAIKDPIDLLAYHMAKLGELLSFSYGGPNSLLGFALSVFLFAFAVCFVIFLFYAGIVYESKGKNIIWLAILAVFIGFVIYSLLASGLSLYIDIIKGEGIYAEQGALAAMTYCVLVSGCLFFVLSIISYFLTLVHIFKEDEKREEEKPHEGKSPLPKKKAIKDE